MPVGVVMELQDSALPLMAGIHITSNAMEALKDADYAILISSIPRKNIGAEDHLKANAKLFRSFGTALNKVGKATMKVDLV